MNKAYFPLKFWITNHTKFPSYGYAEGHISSRTVAKWDPDPKCKRLEDALNSPTQELLEEILAEKDEATPLTGKQVSARNSTKPLQNSSF